MSDYDQTHSINRRPAGAADSSGGRFDFRDHPEADSSVKLGEEASSSEHAVRVKALDELEASGERFDLAFVYYDEKMPDDLLRLALAGDEDAYMEEFSDRYFEAEADDIDRAIERFDEEHGTDFADLDDTDEDRERLKDYIWSHDDSDREKDLLRYTGKKMLRAPISGYGTLDGSDTYWANPSDGKAWNRLTRNRETLLSEKLSEAGVDMTHPANRRAVEELVSEGPETWHEEVRLDVIWHGDVRDALPGDAPKTLTFANPYVVLIDTLNGSGSDARFMANVAVTIGARADGGPLPDGQHARLDDEEHGYGWDQTAGLVHDAYNSNFRVDVAEPATV